MPINEATAKKQIGRFSDFPGFPETGEALLELVKAFLLCETDEQAEQVGDYLMRTQKDYCPKPAHVYDAIDIVRQNQPEPFFQTPVRGPDDEPFNGLSDLIDDKVIERLRDRAVNGKTHADRVCATNFLRGWDAMRAKDAKKLEEAKVGAAQ